MSCTTPVVEADESICDGLRETQDSDPGRAVVPPEHGAQAKRGMPDDDASAAAVPTGQNAQAREP